jgi:hypothetical protein
MPTDPTELEAAEAAVVAANAEVARLRAVLADEHAASTAAATPRAHSREDVLAAVRRRHGRTRTEQVAGTGTAEGDAAPLTGAAAGLAAARRRAAARGRGGDAA